MSKAIPRQGYIAGLAGALIALVAFWPAGATWAAPSESECLSAPELGGAELFERFWKSGDTPATRSGDFLLPIPVAAEEMKTAPEEYSLGDIVDAVSDSASNARRVAGLAESVKIELVDISILFQGAGRAALETALNEHREAVKELRVALFESTELRNELLVRGLDKLEVVAVEFPEEGALFVFARHP